jgi:hypothetical protein
MRVLIGAAGVMHVALLAGCGGGGTAPPAARPAVEAQAAIDLPPIDPQSMITVDDDRVSVASPAGWSRAPRSKDCLVRYLPATKGGYPSITVLVGAAPASLTSVTAENHDAFIAAVAADLDATFVHQGTSTLTRRPRGLTLGPHRAVAWTAPGRATVGGMKQEIERDCVALVIDGRMYTVEARAPKGRLDAAGRAAARAVAAAMLPAGAAAADSPAAPAAEPDEAAPPTPPPTGDAAPPAATE